MAEIDQNQMKELIERFTDKFNTDDLDGAMTFFTDDALYVEYNGKPNHGKQAIRKALEPQFRGDYGIVRFQDKDFTIDEKARKAVFNWWCTMEVNGKSLRWEGLDIFQFEDGLIKEKRTFAQTDIIRFNPMDILLIFKFVVYAARQKISVLFS